MLDSCGQHNTTADVEILPVQKINEAYERLLKGDMNTVSQSTWHRSRPNRPFSRFLR